MSKLPPARLLLALAAILPALSAPARAQTPPSTPPTWAVLSLVGDQLDAVTYQPQIGTHLDANSHQPIPMGGADVLDTVALRATNKALRASAPFRDVALLAASSPETFVDESRFFSGGHVTLPADVEEAVRQAGASCLVLITKHRADARLRVRDGFIGSGKLEGLGFYLDTVHRMRDGDTAERTVGFLAPFAYVDVTLVDVASHAVLRQVTITASETVTPTRPANGAAVWDALSGPEKIAALSQLLSSNLAQVVPQLVRERAPDWSRVSVPQS